ncbi:hypothetical protein V6N13_046104 [Hibiscus sabdariffa]|uniref:Uncharacterized protein n=2 Tax=Hibiscus sabdariffa TaxID=183260 RepID=A0ABR2B531_9ROSI
MAALLTSSRAIVRSPDSTLLNLIPGFDPKPEPPNGGTPTATSSGVFRALYCLDVPKHSRNQCKGKGKGSKATEVPRPSPEDPAVPSGRHHRIAGGCRACENFDMVTGR